MTNTDQTMTLPTIHSNGTSHKDLTEGYDKAASALYGFIDAWGEIDLNARDYYVQGPDAYQQARDERMGINQKIREIKSYLYEIRMSLYSQSPK
jgi:hypothetical protein